MNRHQRQEMAYWLTLAFRLEREPRRDINGLVLTADRKLQLGLLDLVRMDAEARPPEIARYGSTLDRLLAAEGKASAQAFLVDQLLAMDGRLVPITDSIYPRHVAERIGPVRAPSLLTALGNPDLWKVPGVAISGSRKAGPLGLAFARAVGRSVATAAEVVVCGLASGVDTEALEGALEAGGRVLGISAEGVIRSRWRSRREVREGRLTIVSEFAPDEPWSAGRAMARNRTIAGFSRALVIADCVASGGTTDQLDVHRALGLPVYVRRGPGEGALVDELCRRPGVTPWYWRNGPATWPPRGEDLQTAPARSSLDCAVTLSADRLRIEVDAPRQLTLDAVIDSIRAEYGRVAAATTTYPALTAVAAASKASEASPTPYRGGPEDPLVSALTRAGASGATAADLIHATGLTKYRVGKRIAELLDAQLICKRSLRYYPLGVAANAPPAPPKRPRRVSPPRPDDLLLF